MADAARAADSTITVWAPQAGPQLALVRCPVFEVFYGGARGGGKTDGVLGDFISHAAKYGANAIGLMARRERVQLIETIERSKELYTPLGARYHEQDKMWRFPDGARLRFAYLERDADAEAYQGHSYTRVYIEEIGNFPSEKPVMKLMATLRSSAGVPVGFRATGNPGGPGHSWVKARYIDPAPSGWERIRDPNTGLERVYIPSRVGDNRYLGDDYIQRLRMSGSAELVRAWLSGDWSAIEGAFFDCWSTDKHVVTPFVIPDHWVRYRSFDWGFAAPFSVGWWAVASESVSLGGNRDTMGAAPGWDDRSQTIPKDDRGQIIPRGALIRYREWYGASAPNVGIRLEAEQIAEGILGRDKNETITFAVADTQIFAQDGRAYGYTGPTIAERMAKAGVIWRPADKSRHQGWDQMRSRMVGDLDGNPMMVVFNTCSDFIRTVPMLQHDQLKPEDIDTESEDHIADDARYAAMARPWTRPSLQPDKPIIDVRVPTLADLVKRHDRNRRGRIGRI